jgi:hypothetical protein
MKRILTIFNGMKVKEQMAPLPLLLKYKFITYDKAYLNGGLTL